MIDIAVVGVGHIGSVHARHATTFGNLVAVCDIKKERMQGFDCNKYESIDELLKNEHPNLVSVCTPNSFHCGQTVCSLENGCNVLCEKPMALTIRECELMIHTAEHMNKRLFVVKQNRFNPSVLAVKKALDDGLLGKVFFAQVNCFWNRDRDYYQKSDWRGTWMDGGVLFTQFSHFIDLLLWFVGGIRDIEVEAVSFDHDFIDTGSVLFCSYSGVIGSLNFTVNSFNRNMEGSLTLFCEKGTVKIGGEYLNRIEYQSCENQIIPDVSLSCATPNMYGSNMGTMSNHDKVYENVVGVLENNGSVMTDMLDGLKTVEFIERVYGMLK